MATNNTTNVKPFGMADKIGYAFGDFGNDFTFILTSSWMMVFYSSVMGVSTAITGTVMMLARFVDAVTDVTMGQIVDRSKPTKDGKFRPWIRRMCIPCALACFLIFQAEFSGAALGFKIGWMAITYILWGSFMYTSVNIPYGSMASAITQDPNERAQLSVWRNIGATLAGLAIGTLPPLFVYAQVNGQNTLVGSRMMILAGIFAVCAVICHMLCFNLTTERVQVPQNTTKLNVGAMLKSVVTNRSLLGIIAAAILLLLGMLGMQGMMAYMFPYYFNNSTAQSICGLGASLAILIVVAPLASKLAMKFGKREVSMISCLLGGITFLILLVVRTTNAYVYIVFYMIAYIFLGFFNALVWAMITDVIDDAEVKNGIREDGTIYAVYSFARKIGQALSSGMIGALLGVVGWGVGTQEQIAAQLADPWSTPGAMNGMYNVACLVPAIGLLLVSAALIFIYPLSKSKVEANVAELARRRGE